MIRTTLALLLGSVLGLGSEVLAQSQAQTSLGRKIKFTVADRESVTLKRGDVTAVVVNNQAGGKGLPGHRAGYSGVASLTHSKQTRNLFVPSYAGLNFEHIHDGTTQGRDILFEPRRDPMELRIINKHTVELYQAPTSTWGLESCHRYELLADGTIQMTFECIPRRRTFRNNYIGLFWASYIHQPESLDIHFRGRPAKEPNAAVRWVRGVTPRHGVLATHVGADDKRRLQHDADFPLTLAFNRSNYRFAEPWYFGISRKMAAVYLFRPVDQIRLTQSPSGGGNKNPAWDFQFFIPDYKIGKRYKMVMRLMYIPYESHEQVARQAASQLRELAKVN